MAEVLNNFSKNLIILIQCDELLEIFFNDRDEAKDI